MVQVHMVSDLLKLYVIILVTITKKVIKEMRKKFAC